MYTDEAVAATGSAFGISGETLVAVTEVTRRYARRGAVHRLSLRLWAGEVAGLVGSNGSGKTTTLRMLAGILKPDEGHGQVLGFDLVSEAAQIRERQATCRRRYRFTRTFQCSRICVFARKSMD